MEPVAEPCEIILLDRPPPAIGTPATEPPAVADSNVASFGLLATQLFAVTETGLLSVPFEVSDGIFAADNVTF